MSTIERTVGYIGNFRPNFSTESHVALSLESLPGVKVIRVQEDDADWRWIPGHAKAAGCDFVMWTHTHGYADESKHDDCSWYLQTMRDIGIPTVGYHLDRWWGLEREYQVYEPFFQQDLVCTADGGHANEWENIGVNHHWMPPGVVHTEVGRGVMQSRYVKDVGFLGSWRDYGHRGLWPWRYEMVLMLNRRYSSKFRAWPRGGMAIRGWEINSLYASVKAMVGDSCLAPKADGSPMTMYCSDRVPETCGRGGLLVHPRVEGVTDGGMYFEDEHLVCYDAGDERSMFDAIESVLAMSDDERNWMIDRAIEHTREHHTYRRRCEQLFVLVDDYKRGGGDGDVGGTEGVGGGAAFASTVGEDGAHVREVTADVRVEGGVHEQASGDARGDDDRVRER